MTMGPWLDRPTDAGAAPGYVEVWWQAVNDFLDLLEELPEEEWSDADRPGRLGRARRRRAHRAPRGASSPARPEETADVGEPRARDRADGALHRDRRGQPARREPRRDHQRDPRGGDHAAHRAARRPAHRRRRQADADLRRRRPGPGARCCATGRSTSGCTSRTYAARSAAPAAWTARRPRTPRSTSPRASATCSARRSARRAGTTVVLDIEGSAPFAFGDRRAGRGERLPDGPGQPTVTLRMDRESFIRLAGGRRRPEPGAVSLRGRPELGRRVVDALAITP